MTSYTNPFGHMPPQGLWGAALGSALRQAPESLSRVPEVGRPISGNTKGMLLPLAAHFGKPAYVSLTGTTRYPSIYDTPYGLPIGHSGFAIPWFFDQPGPKRLGGGGGFGGFGLLRALTYLLRSYILHLLQRKLAKLRVDREMDGGPPADDPFDLRYGDAIDKRDDILKLSANAIHDPDLTRVLKPGSDFTKVTSFDQLAELAIDDAGDANRVLELVTQYADCEITTANLIDALAQLAASNLSQWGAPWSASNPGLGRALAYVEHLRKTCRSEIGHEPQK